MLAITVPATEFFDEKSSTFVETDSFTIELEHSLASLSKWEQIFEKPFLGPEPHTRAQTIEYIRCMCLTPEVPPDVFQRLTAANFDAINEYVNKKMTATWFNETRSQGRGREIVTAEVVYFWMSHYSIPFEAENWHFNRLMTLIRVANAKNDTGKKKQGRMSKSEMMAQRRSLNEQRLAQNASNG